MTRSFEKRTTEDITVLKSDVSTLKADVKQLNHSLNLIATQVGQNTADIHIIKEAVNSTRASQVVMERQMGELLTLMREGFAPKAAQNEKRLDNHEQRISHLEQQG